MQFSMPYEVMCHCNKLLDCLVIFMLKAFLCTVVRLAIFSFLPTFLFFCTSFIYVDWEHWHFSIFLITHTHKHTHWGFPCDIHLYFVKVGEQCILIWLWSSKQVWTIFNLQQNNNNNNYYSLGIILGSYYSPLGLHYFINFVKHISHIAMGVLKAVHIACKLGI